MHELTITQAMLDIVLEQAQKASAKKVGAINLVIGELSGFVEESVRFYFDFLAKDTIAEGAVLNFKSVSPRARCQGCGKLFELREFDWSCPGCGGGDVEITAGKELSVESITVE
jgi:hydrogenase nickel incorporation protein HypA/HybF